MTCICGAALSGRRRKWCSVKCKSRHTSAEFRRKYPDKWKAINNKASAAYRRRNPGSKRWEKIKADFGLTRQEWEAVFATQGNACAICGTTDFGKKSPCNDHDHKTGRFRGILCDGCNVGLGRFLDDPKRLRCAAGYLECK